MVRRINWWLLLFFVGCFISFFIRGYVTEDPDFGWHIQAGNNILANGITYTDPFSYSMPSYPFVDHEWLTNAVWALVYRFTGELPLVIISSLLGVGSLVIQALIVKRKWIIIPLFLAAGTLFEFVGVRTQIITWFLVSLLSCLLWDKQLWQRWRYFLPLLFILWANIHGGFGIGLGILLIFLIGKSLEEKKFSREYFYIGFLCTLATLINPFGIGLWWEFFMQLTDTQLRWSISEWYPAIYFVNTAFWFYFALSLFLVIRYRKYFSWTALFLYFFLLLEGMLSMRNIPIWVIVSFALTMQSLELLAQESARFKFGKERFAIAYRGLAIIALFFYIPQFGGFFYGVYGHGTVESTYPNEALVYLQTNLPSGNIFTSYDWGGYFILHLPDRKMFIDGRMPSWRWTANLPGESNYAFQDYKDVLAARVPFATFADKYGITTLVVHISDLKPQTFTFLGIPIKKTSWLNKFFYSDFTFYEVTQEAKKMGWTEVYRDKKVVIFQKPGAPS